MFLCDIYDVAYERLVEKVILMFIVEIVQLFLRSKEQVAQAAMLDSHVHDERIYQWR